MEIPMGKSRFTAADDLRSGFLSFPEFMTLMGDFRALDREYDRRSRCVFFPTSTGQRRVNARASYGSIIVDENMNYMDLLLYIYG